MRSSGWVRNGLHDARYPRSGQFPLPLPPRRTAWRCPWWAQDVLYPHPRLYQHDGHHPRPRPHPYQHDDQHLHSWQFPFPLPSQPTARQWPRWVQDLLYPHPRPYQHDGQHLRQRQRDL